MCPACAAGGRLHQEPAPELAQLRSQDACCVSASGYAFGPDDGCLLPEVKGPRADVAFTLRRGGSSAAGLLLRAWLHPANGSAEATAAALVMDWERGALEVRPASPAPATVLHCTQRILGCMLVVWGGGCGVGCCRW